MFWGSRLCFISQSCDWRAKTFFFCPACHPKIQLYLCFQSFIQIISQLSNKLSTQAIITSSNNCYYRSYGLCANCAESANIGHQLLNPTVSVGSIMCVSGVLWFIVLSLCLQKNIQCILIESICKRVSCGLKILMKLERREEEACYAVMKILTTDRNLYNQPLKLQKWYSVSASFMPH